MLCLTAWSIQKSNLKQIITSYVSKEWDKFISTIIQYINIPTTLSVIY